MGGPGGEEGGHQALAGLSDYELSHLVAHLAQASRPGDVDRLLALEAPGGRNAWFEAKEGSQGLSGYISDVEAAIALVRDGRQARAAQSLAVRYRYSLMLASVSALAGQVTPPLLAALVRHGIWTLDDALAVARRAPRAQQRAEALIALGAHVPQSERAALVSDAVQAIGDAQRHISAASVGSWTLEHLTAAAHLASGDARDRLVAEAVGHVVRMLRGPDNWAFKDSLERLGPLLSPAQIADLVNAAVRSRSKMGASLELTLLALADWATGSTAEMIARAAKHMDQDWRQVAVLTRVAPNLPSRRRARALRAAPPQDEAGLAATVLPAGQQELVGQAIVAAETEAEPLSRLGSLLQLAPQTDGQTRGRLYEALAAAAREVGAGDQEPEAPEVAELLESTGDLPGPLRAAITDAVLTAVRRVRVIDERIRGLAEVAQHVEDPRRTEILTEAVSALADADLVVQSLPLADLAPTLSRQHTIEALRIARVIGDGEAIGAAVAALAPFRSYPPEADLPGEARSAAAAVAFGPMKMYVLAGFAQRLTGHERASVLAYALRLIFPDPGSPDIVPGVTDAADCVAIVAPLIAAEDSAVVVQAWLRSLPIAASVYDPNRRAQRLIGLLASRPRPDVDEPARGQIVDSLKDTPAWQLPQRAELLVALVPRVPVPARGQLIADLALAALMDGRFRRPDDPALSERALAIVAGYLPDEDRRAFFQQPASVLGEEAWTPELRKTINAVRRAPLRSSAAGRYFASPDGAEAFLAKAERAAGPARAAAVIEALIAAHGDQWWRIWQQLGPALAALSEADLRAGIERLLADRALLDRAGLCADIAHLAPALARLGGRDMADELTRALRDIERWWP